MITTHLMVDGVSSEPERWTPTFVTEFCRRLAAIADMRIFAGPEVREHGSMVMAVTLIAESHISLHLDRATGQAWADVFSCRAVPDAVALTLATGLAIASPRVTRLERTTL